MSRRNRSNYTRYSAPEKVEEAKIDVPVEETGQEETPEESTYEKAMFVDNDPVVEETVEEALVIEEEPEIPLPEKATCKKGKVDNCDMVNVRKAPEATALVVSIISKGEEVTIHEEVDGFYKVTVNSSGLSGYINKNYVSII